MDLKALLMLKNSIKCDYEEGVYIEIIASLERDNEHIEDFVLDYNNDTKSYIFKIVLADLKLRSAKEVFF